MLEPVGVLGLSSLHPLAPPGAPAPTSHTPCSRPQIVASFRVTSGASNTTALKTIEYARRGECFLVNSVDRVIRVYDAKKVLAAGVDGDPEPVQKLQDQVRCAGGGSVGHGGLC